MPAGDGGESSKQVDQSAAITIIVDEEAAGTGRRRCNERVEIHRVCLPPLISTLERLKRDLLEIFFLSLCRLGLQFL